MNGGMTECNVCDCDPCKCKQIEARKQKQRIKDGTVAIESLWQAMSRLPRWRMKIVKWIWPDFVQVSQDFLDYYWADRDEEN